MEKKFTTIEEIQKEFSILDDNPEVIEKELQKLLAENHPDKTGGKFLDDNQEERYFLISKAIDSLKNLKNENTQVVPISVFNSLVDIIKENKNVVSKNDNNLLIQHSIDNAIKRVPSQNLFPKISLSTITGIISFIWFFPNTIKEHPILSDLIKTNNKYFTLIWAIILLFTIYFWLITLFSENKQKSFIESLNTELTQEDIFQRFIHSDYLIYHDDITFYKADLVKFIENKTYHHSFNKFILFKRNIIPTSLAESIADKIIEIAKNRQIIEEVKSNSLSPRFKFLDPQEFNYYKNDKR